MRSSWGPSESFSKVNEDSWQKSNEIPSPLLAFFNLDIFASLGGLSQLAEYPFRPSGTETQYRRFVIMTRF